ncbi:4'-phosphopantetheinyl transferase [Trametopsis cervina]|nr:4'-phosphopantetheinyl transferase [Trametopsis cervina]
MGILGVGVDVVHLPRIAALINRRTAPRLASRILSTTELEQWRDLSGADPQRQTSFLAVRWSLKEAAYKAVFPHVHPTWKEFTYHGLNNESRLKPTLAYHPLSRIEHNVGKIHCSVSHDGEYVFTTVLVEGC